MNAHKLPLLAPELSSFTSESFYEHVSALKRIPNRASKRPSAPKLPKLRAKLCVATSTLKLSCGSAEFALTYITVKDGRKRLKLVYEAQVTLAAAQLLQNFDTLCTLVVSKKLLIRKDPSV